MTDAELTAEWDGPSDKAALEHLAERGFKIGPDWTWIIPFGLDVADKDLRAVLFLSQEWDYSTRIFEEPERIPPHDKRH